MCWSPGVTPWELIWVQAIVSGFILAELKLLSVLGSTLALTQWPRYGQDASKREEMSPPPISSAGSWHSNNKPLCALHFVDVLRATAEVDRIHFWEFVWSLHTKDLFNAKDSVPLVSLLNHVVCMLKHKPSYSTWPFFKAWEVKRFVHFCLFMSNILKSSVWNVSERCKRKNYGLRILLDALFVRVCGGVCVHASKLWLCLDCGAIVLKLSEDLVIAFSLRSVQQDFAIAAFLLAEREK